MLNYQRVQRLRIKRGPTFSRERVEKWIQWIAVIFHTWEMWATLAVDWSDSQDLLTISNHDKKERRERRLTSCLLSDAHQP